MAGITCYKHMGMAVFGITHIVKLVSEAVADVINRPPHHLFDIERLGFDDAIGSCNHVILGEFFLCSFFVWAYFVQLDIHAEKIATFSR